MSNRNVDSLSWLSQLEKLALVRRSNESAQEADSDIEFFEFTQKVCVFPYLVLPFVAKLSGSPIFLSEICDGVFAEWGLLSQSHATFEDFIHSNVDGSKLFKINTVGQLREGGEVFDSRIHGRERILRLSADGDRAAHLLLGAPFLFSAQFHQIHGGQKHCHNLLSFATIQRTVFRTIFLNRNRIGSNVVTHHFHQILSQYLANEFDAFALSGEFVVGGPVRTASDFPKSFRSSGLSSRIYDEFFKHRQRQIVAAARIFFRFSREMGFPESFSGPLILGYGL